MKKEKERNSLEKIPERILKGDEKRAVIEKTIGMNLQTIVSQHDHH